MPTITVENYLKQIVLEQQKLGNKRVPMGRVAASLGVVPGTATTMVKSLAESGLADYAPRKGVKLTAKGKKHALGILRRHRLIEVFLVKILGFDWGEIHADAERLEHAISDAVLARLDKLCGYPKYDPHGDPIPSAKGKYRTQKQKNLLECPLNKPFHIARILNQDTEFLKFAENRGLIPDANLRVKVRDLQADAVKLELERGKSLTLSSKVAEKILVK